MADYIEKNFESAQNPLIFVPLYYSARCIMAVGVGGGGQNRLNNFAQFCLGRGCKTDLQENGPSSLGVGPKLPSAPPPPLPRCPTPHPPSPHTHNGMSEFAKSICSRIVLIVDCVTFLRQLVQNVKSKCLQLK